MLEKKFTNPTYVFHYESMFVFMDNDEDYCMASIIYYLYKL
jgi:hypothetical protein